MKTRGLIIFGLVTIISAPVIAQGYYPRSYSQPSRETQEPGPATIVRENLQKLIEFVGTKSPPTKKQLLMYLDAEVAPYFDFQRMARWSAAGSWKRMSNEQKLVLRAKIQEMFLGSLTKRLMSYGGQGFRILPARGRPGNEVQVGVLIRNPQGYPSKLNFRFYKSKDGWKIFDVTANGNSAVVYYRQYFNRMMGMRPHAAVSYPPYR